MIIKDNIKIAYLSILFTLSFCVYSYGSDGFDPSDWDNKYTETGAPVHLDNKNYGSPNYFNLHIFAPKINPDWDPTDPSSPMWVYGPGSFYFDMSSFADDTTISSNGSGVGYHVTDSTFNGSTSVDNIVYTGGDMMTVDKSTFNDDTYVLTAESRATSGDVGTQINESTFNDNTTFSVADGGVLELNNSTINLANDDLMSKYFGLSESNPDSIFQRFYYSFMTSLPLVTDTGGYSSNGAMVFNNNPAPFYSVKLGGFVDINQLQLVFPDNIESFGYTSIVDANTYGSNLKGTFRSNFAYFSLFTLYPLLRNLYLNYSSSVDYIDLPVFIRNNNNVNFRTALLFKTTQYTASKVDERPVLTGETVYCTLPALIDIQFKNVAALVTQVFNVFADWYYPISDMTDQYWRFYNTDTGEQEATNLAGVLYNITWYLGELYKTNDWEAAQGFKDAQDTIDNLTEDMSSAESAITDTVLPNIQDFSPDPSDVASLSGLSFVGSFIQDFYLALGVFGIPVMLSLILAVCMQLIGYFKYKR